MKRVHIYTETIIPKQRNFVDAFPQLEIVGALLYLSMVTHVDIACAVGVLTHRRNCPTFEARLADCVSTCQRFHY